MNNTEKKNLKVALRLRYGKKPFQCLFCAHSSVLSSPRIVMCRMTQETVDKNRLCTDFIPAQVTNPIYQTNPLIGKSVP